MRNIKRQSGFTLVELIITVTIFSIFMLSIVTLTIDLYRNSRRIQLQEQLFQDMRAMMRQVTILIEDNAIDYEEYYRASIGDAYLAGLDAVGDYTYGDYGRQFYDFGSDGAAGVLCNDGSSDLSAATCVIDKTTVDTNTGQFVDAGGDAAGANAFFGGADQTVILTPDQDQLYLLNEKGNKKQVLALESVERTIDGVAVIETVLSTLWLNGTDGDGDDVTDTWVIAPEFNTASNDALADLIDNGGEAGLYDGFIPISPMRTNITGLKFHIDPLEDPYKAFAETDPATGTLVQPHVTIVLTAQPSAAELGNYLGPIPTRTLQTTVYSEIKHDVRTY